MSREVPFVDRDVPEIFASRVAKVELLSGSVVRFWMVVEEQHGKAETTYLLTLKILIPLEGVMANRELLTEVLAGKVVRDVDGEVAVH